MQIGFGQIPCFFVKAEKTSGMDTLKAEKSSNIQFISWAFGEGGRGGA